MICNHVCMWPLDRSWQYEYIWSQHVLVIYYYGIYGEDRSRWFFTNMDNDVSWRHISWWSTICRSLYVHSRQPASIYDSKVGWFSGGQTVQTKSWSFNWARLSPRRMRNSKREMRRVACLEEETTLMPTHSEGMPQHPNKQHSQIWRPLQRMPAIAAMVKACSVHELSAKTKMATYFSNEAQRP